MHKEISHYEIKGFKNIKAGFIYFDTQSSLKNNTLPFIGREIIKMTTGAGIEHIGYASKVPEEFVNLQYEDEYNGKDIIGKGYVLFEATNHYDSICTNLTKRMERPSLNDINKAIANIKHESQRELYFQQKELVKIHIEKKRLEITQNFKKKNC